MSEHVRLLFDRSPIPAGEPVNAPLGRVHWPAPSPHEPRQSPARPRRVAFFVWRFPQLSESFIANAALALMDQGCEIDIYALDRPGNALNAGWDAAAAAALESATVFPNPGTSVLGRTAILAQEIAQLVRKGDMRRLRSLDPRLFGRQAVSLRALAEARAFRHGGRYDILHCQFLHLAFPVLRHLQAGHLSGRLVVHMRGHDIGGMVAAREYAALRTLFNGADRIASICDYFRHIAVEHGCPEDKVDFVPSGIHVDAFPFRARTAADDGVLRVLSVGRLVEKKGIQHGLQAVARLRARGVNVHYRIVGYGPLLTTLQQSAAALGIADHVTFDGALEPPAVRDRLEDAHLFLAPCVQATNGDIDGPQNTIKEASASGLPVVSSDMGAIPEAVSHAKTGLLVPPGDDAAIADAIETLANQPERWPEMGSCGRRLVASLYDIETTTRAALACYQRALSTPAKRPEQEIAQ